MVKIKKQLVQKVLALLLCAVMTVGLVPFSAFSVENPLALPASVSLIDEEGFPFVPGQEVSLGESFYVNYNYGTVENIDSSIKYLLPTLSNHIEVVHAAGEDEIVVIPVKDEELRPLGTLEINTLTGAMTFQFDERFDGQSIDGFFLKFAVMLDEDAVNLGDDIVISFPIQGGEADFDVTVVDADRDPPKIAKSGALSADVSETGDVEILWTVTVTNGENPHPSISIQDKWLNNNQNYVDGSFCKNGEPVTDGLTLNADGSGFQYLHTDITPNSTDVFTYKTSIRSSAFLKNGVPLTGGTIKCTNTAQVFYPGGSDTPLTGLVTAAYNHPIKWLYKTSGNVIDRETGEMEWTITIYNNGLGMHNVVLYDRLSPGVVIKDDTATIQIGDGPVQTLDNFTRMEGDDLLYNSEIGREYNLSYDLGSVDNVAVITYRSIIENMAAYDAGAHLPPDSMFDNRAFITYQLPSGEGLGAVIGTPVVEKTGGYDEGLIGKVGAIEAAYHTILWTMTVNNDEDTLEGVKVSDRLTYAAPLLPDENGVYTQPGANQLCHHIYDDSISRNRPQYSLDGAEPKVFAPYDAEYPTAPFTYRLVPTGTETYDIVFYLGDIDKKVVITFRSTATDEIIFANNVTSNFCRYENRATLLTGGNAFSYTSADVLYKSNVYQKNDARSWYNKVEHTYNYEENQLPWQMRVNINQMEMKNICITDVLSEGTSLVEGSMIVGLGSGAWYKLSDEADTKSIPKYTTGAVKPYYTYNEETRELKIYLEDITGSVVGTDDATRQVVFYVQVDVNHPIFNDPTYPGYINNKNGVWVIPNTGSLENNYLSDKNSVVDSAGFNVGVQHLSKSGAAYKNGAYYSIDYSIGINRIQQQLPENAVVQDILPAGLRLDASTLRLYEATAISPTMFYVNDNGTNGKLVKGAEIDSQLFQVTTTVNEEDHTSIMRVTLPQDSDTKMYILEYSCDVTDTSKAPFTNSACIEGVEQSNADQTTTRLLLSSATGGGTLREARKTTVYLHKTDTASGDAVAGAVFGIYYNGLLLETKTTDANGQITFANLNEGYTYTVTELAAAPGYLAPINVTETFVATESTNPITLDFDNPPILGTAQFLKTDENGVALPGAAFGLWANEADVGVAIPMMTATSGQNGVVSFTSLTAGNTYFIAEISAPEDYQKSEEVIVVEMNISGALEKLWLRGDETETAITTFENSRTPLGALVVSKAVTGSMGDRTRAFSFTLSVSASDGLPDGSTLHGVKTAADGSETEVTLAVGEPYPFTLTHGELLTVSDLQLGTEYTVAENDYSADGYTTSHVTTRNDAAGTPTDGRAVTGTIAADTNAEAFTNAADVAVPTGVDLDLRPYVLILLLAAIGGAILLGKKKRTA